MADAPGPTLRVTMTFDVPYNSYIEMDGNPYGPPPGAEAPGGGPATGTPPPVNLDFSTAALTGITTQAQVCQKLLDVRQAGTVKLLWDYMLSEKAKGM